MTNASESAMCFHALHEIFEAQADARPDAVAVEFGEEKTTCSHLEQHANRLARHLRGRGVGRGSLSGPPSRPEPIRSRECARSHSNLPQGYGVLYP